MFSLRETSQAPVTYTLSHFCTRFIMEPPSKPELRTSKRKRTQVNYREEPLSDDDGDDFPLEEKEQEEDDVKRTPRAKVRSLPRCVLVHAFEFFNMLTHTRSARSKAPGLSRRRRYSPSWNCQPNSGM